MILHRFMSEREFVLLMQNTVLHNDTDHAAQGCRTDAVGFCFFPEDPEKAVHWMSFLVYMDYCVTMEVPDGMVRAARGRYRDVEADEKNGMKGEPPMLWRTEYCTTEYSLQQVRVLAVTDKYKLYGRIPEEASFFERIERLRVVGEMENERINKADKED